MRSAPPITVLPVSPPPALPSSPDSSDPNRKTESENAIPGAGEGSGSNNPWPPAADAPKGQISSSDKNKASGGGEGGRVPKRDSPSAVVPSVLDKRILDTEDMWGEEDRQVDKEDAVKGFVDSLLRDGGLWMTTFEMFSTINLYK